MNYIHSQNQIALYNTENKLIAEVTFPSIDENTVDVNHTFVDDSLRGQGIANQLMLELVDELRKQKKKAVLTCSYAIHWFEKNSRDYKDILKNASLK